jgi:hypothetical protein
MGFKLTQEQIELNDEIGRYLGLKMITEFYENFESKLFFNENPNMYYEGKVTEFNDNYYLIYLKNKCYGSKSEYTLDLRTLTPTQNSPIKNCLNETLKNKLQQVYETFITIAIENYKIKSKEYRETNKEKIKEGKKQYRKNNIEKIKERGCEKITCECGAIISRSGISSHKKTKLHQNNLLKI